jgi:hypothetical protein
MFPNVPLWVSGFSQPPNDGFVSDYSLPGELNKKGN